MLVTNTVKKRYQATVEAYFAGGDVCCTFAPCRTAGQPPADVSGAYLDRWIQAPV